MFWYNHTNDFRRFDEANILQQVVNELKIEANEHITRFMRFFYKVLTEALELVTGGGGGSHICLVRDSNPTDVTVRYQNIP